MTTTKKRPGEAFIPFIVALEKEYGLPPNYLYRLAYRESGFLPDVITGRKRSSAGATGIAQLMPVHHYHPTKNPQGVDPLNPWASLRYAAKYLQSHFRRFKNWDLALAAYNWGQGNVAKALEKYKGNISLVLANLPKETAHYVTVIAKRPEVANVA